MSDESTTVRRAVRLAPLLLFLAFGIQLAVAASRDSATYDELSHVPIGLYVIRHRDFRPDPMNSPLARVVLALPTLTLQPRFAPPLGANEWTMGLAFMRDNAERYHALIVAARTAVIVLAFALALLVQRWARELYGEVAATVALALFVFSPSILAHGHLATTDVAGSVGVVGSVYAAWLAARRRGLPSLVLLGTVFGVSLLLKLSCVVATPVVLAVAAAHGAAEGSTAKRIGSAVLGLGVVSVAAGAALNLGYLFQGTLSPLGGIDFLPGGSPHRLAGAFPDLRLPLPSDFLRGIDSLVSNRLLGYRTYYLAGRISREGWWYYHLVAYLLKTPVPFLLAIPLAALAARRDPRTTLLWVTVVLVFVFNGALNPLNLGVRHVMAADPLLCVLVAPVFSRPIVEFRRGRREATAILGLVLACAGLTYQVAATVSVAPRYLEYFNEIGGGRERGHEWLADSNLDWGQDLIRLREFMSARSLESVPLAYFGSVSPAVYGIQFEPLEKGRTHGVAVASPSLAVGLSTSMWKAPDVRAAVAEGEYAWLRELEPVGRVGSMFVYQLP